MKLPVYMTALTFSLVNLYLICKPDEVQERVLYRFQLMVLLKRRFLVVCDVRPPQREDVYSWLLALASFQGEGVEVEVRGNVDDFVVHGEKLPHVPGP